MLASKFNPTGKSRKWSLFSVFLTTFLVLMMMATSLQGSWDVAQASHCGAGTNAGSVGSGTVGSGTGIGTATATGGTTAATIMISASPASVSANGVSSSTISATVSITGTTTPIRDATVNFVANLGNFTVSGTGMQTVLTNSSGVAAASLVSSTAGSATVDSVLMNSAGSPVACPTTTVTFTASTASSITKGPGDTQVGTPGAVLQPMSVLVKDGGGNPKFGVAVVFNTDKGTLDSTPASASKTTTTDGNGQAFATLTLAAAGTPPNVHTITATCTGCTPNTLSVTFTASTAPPDRILKAGGDEQFGIATTALASPLKVVVVNASGTPLQGVSVTWTKNKGTFTSATTTLTDLNGEASVSLTLGTADVAPATHTVTATCATCVTVSSTTFTAISLTAFPFSGSVRSFDVNGAALAASTVTGAKVFITQQAINLSFVAVVSGTGTFTANIAAADGTASVNLAGFQGTGDLPLSVSAAGVQSPPVSQAVLTLIEQGVTVSGSVTTQLGAAVPNAFIAAQEVSSSGASLSGARSIYTVTSSTGLYSLKAAPNGFWNIFAFGNNLGERFVDLNNNSVADVIATGSSGVAGANIVFPATINLTGFVKRNGIAVAANAGVVFGRGLGSSPHPGANGIGASGNYTLSLPVPTSGTNSFIVNASVDANELLPREVRVNSLGQCLNTSNAIVACVQNFDTLINSVTVNFINSGGTPVTVQHAFMSATSSTAAGGETLAVPSGTADVSNATLTSFQLVGGDQALGITSKVYRIQVTVDGFGLLSDTNVTVGPGVVPAAMVVNVTVPVPLVLSGTVTDTGGAAIPNVNVEINSTAFAQLAVTNTTGNYTAELQSGTYRVTASKVGYISSTEVVTISVSTIRNFQLALVGGQNTISGTVAGAPVNVVKSVIAITSDGRTFTTTAGATGPNCGVSAVPTPNSYCMTVGAATITSLKASADGFTFANINAALPFSTMSGSVTNVNLTLNPAQTGRPQSTQCKDLAGCRAEAKGSRITVIVPPGAAGSSDNTLTVTIKETTDAPGTANYTPTLTSTGGVPIAVDISVRDSAGGLISQFASPITFRIEPTVAGSLTGFFNAATGNWVPLSTCSNDSTGTTCTTNHLSKFTRFSASTSTSAAVVAPGTGGGGGGGGGAPSAGGITFPPGTPAGPPAAAGPQTAGPISVGENGLTIGVAGGASVDGGVSVSLPAGSISGQTGVSVTLSNTAPTGVAAPSGSSWLSKTMDITATGDRILYEPAYIYINLTAGDLGSNNVANIRGGVVQNGVVETLATRVIDGPSGLIAVRIEHMSTFVLSAVSQPGPALSGPEYDTVLPGMDTTLSWTNPAGTTQYQIRVVPFNDDGPGIDLVRNVESSYVVKAPNFDGADKNFVMLPGMSYRWLVRTTTANRPPSGLTEADWTAWSVSVFHTGPARFTVDRVAPEALVTVDNVNPTLTWSNSDKTVFYYEVQVSKDENFGPSGFLYWELRHGGVTNPENSYTIPGKYPLEPQTAYFWRVRARVQGDGEPVSWSSTFIFQTP